MSRIILGQGTTLNVVSSSVADLGDSFQVSDARNAISVGVEGTPSGNGSLTYNSTTGVLTYTPPTLAGAGGDTDDIAEGTTNLYFTDARAISAIESNTADLSMSGNIELGQTSITITGPHGANSINAASQARDISINPVRRVRIEGDLDMRSSEIQNVDKIDMSGNIDLNGNDLVGINSIEAEGATLNANGNFRATGDGSHRFIRNRTQASPSGFVGSYQLTFTDGTGVPDGASAEFAFGFEDAQANLLERHALTATYDTTDGNELKFVVSHGESSSDTTNFVIGEAQIRVDQPFRLSSYTVANLPTTDISAGAMAFCTDDVGGSVPVFYDGTDWRRSTDRAVASTT